MKRPYEVQNGCNNPIQAPLFTDPLVPYACSNMRSVSVWAEVDDALIKKYLEPTPFEYVSNVFNISVSDYMNATNCFAGFYDCSFTIPVKYKNIYGSYTMFEYESGDYYVALGREAWGYPKVLADMQFTEGIDKVTASVSKRGREFVYIEVDRKHGQELQAPKAVMYPHLLLQVIPRGEAPGGVLIKRVLKRDTSPDYRGRINITGNAALTLRFDGSNPLDEFSSAKVLCGTYSCGEYRATPEYNGWAHVIDTLVWPDEFK